MKLENMDHIACRARQNIAALNLLLLCTIAIFPAPAEAAGFGELILHSRIGENLLAEVPLFGTSKENSDVTCYALSPRPGSDLPVVSNARLRLIHNKDNYRLLIVGNKPIAEPVFMISLRANCGIDLQHDYVLMPDAPALAGEIIENAAPAHGRQAEDNKAAEQPASAKNRGAPSAQRRAKKKGNHQAARHESQPIAPNTGTTRRAEKAPVTGPMSDRLVLGAAPLELKPGEMPAPKNIDEVEERLLKMETSLRSLNQEIEILNNSLQLSTEMHSAKRELQLAQNVQAPALNASAAAPTTPGDSASENWLELLVSSLLGGSLTVGLAARLGRSKRPPRSTL
jgi:Tfp pilus assembly protein FimV